MTDTKPAPPADPVAHLLDRAERGVILPDEARRLRERVEAMAAALERVYDVSRRVPPAVPGSRDYALGHCAGWNDALDAVEHAAALPAPDTQEPR